MKRYDDTEDYLRDFEREDRVYGLPDDVKRTLLSRAFRDSKGAWGEWYREEGMEMESYAKLKHAFMDAFE